MRTTTKYLLALMIAACAHAGAPAWHDPGYAIAGNDFQPALTLPPGADDAVCRYTTPSGDEGTVKGQPDPKHGDRVQFTIPAGKDVGVLELVASYSGSDDTTATTEPRHVPVGESVKLNITGVAAQELRFPLTGWGTEVLYVPCCNITDGVLQMLRFDSPPTSSAPPSGASLLSPFIMARPDEMVRATAGLNLEFSYDPEGVPGDPSQTLAVLRWDDSRWAEVIAPDIDTDSQTVSFPCTSGGVFVLVAQG